MVQNDSARALLAQHVGCTFEIQARPIQAKLTIESDGKLSPAGALVVPQVCLTLDTAALVKLGWQPGQPLPEQPGLLHVSGDVAMAQTLSTLAKHWRPDLEDLLAQRIGDVAARQVLRGAKGLLSSVWRSSQHVAENVAEYATHETQTITGTAVFESFKANRVALSENISSLEDRLQQFQQRLERTARSQKS